MNRASRQSSPAVGSGRTGGSAPSVTTTENISIGFPPHLDEADSDFIVPLLGGAVVAEAAFSDAVASLAVRAQALIVSATASITAMGNSATEKAQELSASYFT